MTQQAQDFPNYYNGSSHPEFAEELTDGFNLHLKEDQVYQEAWRRFIGANPFGRYDSE
jgi:hypothetical protein